MKKMLVMLTLLCVALLPFAAMAESATSSITWEEVGAPMAEAAGLDGNFYSLEDIGLAIWLPAGIQFVEVSAEDAAAGYLYVASDEEETCLITVDYVNVEGMTLDGVLEEAVAQGMFEPEIVVINGLSAVSYKDEANHAGCIVLVDTNCNVITFTVLPVESEEEELAFALIMSSLMPLE